MDTTVFRAGLFAGKNVFVTGGSSGINLRLAVAFGAAGAFVAINGRKQEKLDAALARLRQQGVTAQAFQADVRDFPRLEEVFAQVAQERGPLDVVVCGAAGNFPAPAAAMSANGFKSVVDIDVLGTFNACRAAFEHLKKPGACVLNVSAPQAGSPYPMQAHVCAAKAAVDMLTRTLALEWGGAGVRVCSIWPGPIDDTEGMARLAATPEAKEKVRRAMPLGRMGTKDDVANLALFLASGAASYCTGGVYAVDGGMGLLGGAHFLDVFS